MLPSFRRQWDLHRRQFPGNSRYSFSGSILRLLVPCCLSDLGQIDTLLTLAVLLLFLWLSFQEASSRLLWYPRAQSDYIIGTEAPAIGETSVSVDSRHILSIGDPNKVI